jgi:hypothetical protein
MTLKTGPRQDRPDLQLKKSIVAFVFGVSKRWRARAKKQNATSESDHGQAGGVSASGASNRRDNDVGGWAFLLSTTIAGITESCKLSGDFFENGLTSVCVSS